MNQGYGAGDYPGPLGEIADVFQKEWRQKQRNGRLEQETWIFKDEESEI